MDRLQKLLDREGGKNHIYSLLLGVRTPDGKKDFLGAAGDATPDSPYLIASVAKMYTASVLLQLADEKRLTLDAPLTDYLPAALLAGIHVYDGIDYSHQLKVYQLMHQTSGLADYFEGRIAEDLKRNHDQAYTVADTVEIARQGTPSAAPDSGKSYYSDTNYQLLGAVIEAVTDQALAEVFQHRLYDRLGLQATYLYDGPTQPAPLAVYYKAQRLHLPQAIASERGAGGVVATLRDSLRFLEGYFGGELFSEQHFARVFQWNKLFFPLQYGYGVMRFQLPRMMSPFQKAPELIGHSGSSGSFAFYAPAEQVYLAGTFNQFAATARPFRFMPSVLNALK